MLNSDIAYVAQFFHSLKDKTGMIDIHQLLYESLQFGISNYDLSELEDQYFLIKAHEKLAS